MIKGWFGFGKKSGSTETMGALLQRKKEALAAIAAAEQPKPVILATKTTPAAPAPVSNPQPKPDEPARTDEQQSTTERLLARKRKLQDEEK